jgi:hypothetical protein
VRDPGAAIAKPGDSKKIESSDQASQTILSAEQIDGLFAKLDKKSTQAANTSVPRSTAAKPVSEIGGGTTSRPSSSRSDVAAPGKAARRRGSTGSARGASYVMIPPPPLPEDHQKAIALATRQTSAKPKVDTAVMGPPSMPASAYRSTNKSPQPPGDAIPASPTSRAGATPRARQSTVGTRNRTSRRSSVSSFASELDARFNIPADGMVFPGMESATDPRMIQAITQTMIGEYLWKYTRKAGRSEMSSSRHRRFFWVHPYTRTLYWSEQDPATAGRAQLKAKSVAIEAVRVITDDNPMPPGLHRKSIIIIAPGRDIKLTATTGQRHETWFNALSYLLLRSTQDAAAGAYVAADGSIVAAGNVAEFDPNSFRGNRPPSSRLPADRTSLSSYNSRPVTVRSSRASSRGGKDPSSPTRGGGGGSGMAAVQRGPTNSQQFASTSSRTSQISLSASLGSRISSYWKPQGRSSVASNRNVSGGRESIYNASVVHDSAEDVRQVLEKQEAEADQLENVRACCDGE